MAAVTAAAAGRAGAVPRSRTQAVILAVAGLVVVGIGGAVLAAPEAFHAGNDIEFGGNPSLLSEIRAAGGALLATGVLVALGAFVRRLTFTAALVGAAVYLAYGLSRLFSMAVDGLPATGLVAATVAELILGAACGHVLYRQRG
ncbi:MULTISPECIES: DUF4345 domain-containing protein [unclassified Solwaraspora]|uniref:DUF4345 domain-containing protein n=1 Tax=unclassified Solwaraspora TaxID=2627926 RepID=UPI00259BBE9B|nr:DUF4345 domain-containing protein [Solwaraspora sp. WMMA2056]WJK40682.1 DUF4345 domain-containing protein [Solwaraspora sp. WMMA2056]